jgi:squalene-associated FAD-dependent desaturase
VRVAVVGGGLAGIAAALSCARKGAEVTLLESRGRLGGAVYSFERDGVRLDNGQHVFLRCCVAYRELLGELGAESKVTVQDRLAIAVLAPGGRRAWLRRSGLPAPLHLAGSVLRYPYLSVAERLSVARAMQALRRVDVDDPAHDAVPFGDWLRDHGQSPAAVEAIWELIVRPTINLRVDDASLAQAAQVFQVGLLSDADAADVGYATVPLSEIHDRAARSALERAGARVRLRTGASAIAAEAAGGFRLSLTGGAEPLAADAVVLAVPPSRASQLLPAGSGVDLESLEALGTSPIVNLHVTLDRRVLDVPFAAAIGSPLQWIFDRTDPAGDEAGAGQHLAITLSAADEELPMTAEALRARCEEALPALLPAARDARIVRFSVTREHAATFRASPGSRARRPGAATALPGLALAGSFTNTGWPATMEGAVRSGRAAAREVLSGGRPAAASTALAVGGLT